jgi:hypothetical protein
MGHKLLHCVSFFNSKLCVIPLSEPEPVLESEPHRKSHDVVPLNHNLNPNPVSTLKVKNKLCGATVEPQRTSLFWLN